MTVKKIQPAVLKQLEDALEERQTPDRRKHKGAILPDGVQNDRRTGDRRSKRAH